MAASREFKILRSKIKSIMLVQTVEMFDKEKEYYKAKWLHRGIVISLSEMVRNHTLLLDVCINPNVPLPEVYDWEGISKSLKILVQKYLDACKHIGMDPAVVCNGFVPTNKENWIDDLIARLKKQLRQ